MKQPKTFPSETIEEPDQEITEEFAAEEVPIDIPDDSDLDESAMASKDIPDGPELEEIVSEFDTFDDMSQDMSSFGEEDLDASDTSDIDSQASQQVPTDDDDYEVSFSEKWILWRIRTNLTLMKKPTVKPRNFNK